MSERVDAIVVPRGAESAAVRRGVLAKIRVIECAAGASAAKAVEQVEPGARIAIMGLCGALDPALRVGATVVYARLVAPESVSYDPSSAIVAGVLGARLVAAASVDRVIGSSTAKAALRTSTGADVCDMEAAAIANACSARGIRALTIRVVSDAAASELPDLSAAYDADGSIRPLALARTFFREPLRSAGFVRSVLGALNALERTAAAFVT